jgi:hypothetical protein
MFGAGFGLRFGLHQRDQGAGQFRDIDLIALHGADRNPTLPQTLRLLRPPSIPSPCHEPTSATTISPRPPGLLPLLFSPSCMKEEHQIVKRLCSRFGADRVGWTTEVREMSKRV